MKNLLKTTLLSSIIMTMSSTALATSTNFNSAYVAGVNVTTQGLNIKIKGGGLVQPQIVCRLAPGINNGDGFIVQKTNPIYDELLTLMLSARLSGTKINFTFNNDSRSYCEITAAELSESF